MSALTELLKDFLQQFTLQTSQSKYSRLVLGGLPKEVLKDLFLVLTQDSGFPWEPKEGIQIPVFLVTRNPIADGAGASRICNWDYALAIRNTYPSFLLLVDPMVWDDRTYSIINATDTVGLPLPPIRRNVPPLRKWSEFYAKIVEMAARRIGIESSIVEEAIREALRDLPSLDSTQQHLLPWQIVEEISSLSSLAHITTPSELARVCGLLPFDGDAYNFGRSRATLKRLAEFLEDSGIEEGIEELKLTSKGDELEIELDALLTQLRRSAGSASAIVRAPSYYLSRGSQNASWRDALTVEVIDEMLAEVGHSAEPDKITLACIEPLNQLPSAGEPYLFEEKVILEVKHPEGDFKSLRISRRLGRQVPKELTSSDECESPFTYEDAAVPVHNAPVTYSADAYGATPASVRVISLAEYGPGAFVTCPGSSTSKVTGPRKTVGQEQWKQEFFLRSGGLHTLKVFCGPKVSTVKITEPSEYHVECEANEGVADLQIDLDDDVELVLDLMDSDGHLISSFALSISIEEEQGEILPSRFHALMRAHHSINSSVSPARPMESWLRGAENEILNRESSWRPILATPRWADSRPRLNESRLLGKSQLQFDPRPLVNPPSSFLKAREQVVEWLCSLQVSLPEADLANEEAHQIATGYLHAYRKWGECAPAEASWVDTISIMEPESVQYGGQVLAASEPVAVLVSPLHPVRFGWHVAAQRVLKSGLNAPCPLAGLLDPHRCPEVQSLALARSGGEPRWTSYVAISCRDVMWGLYWSSVRLRDMPNHKAVRELVVAGVVPRGVQSGFTASQAEKTLDEVCHVLPTRAILRIGIVGSNQGGTSCTEGIFTWSRETYSKESDSLVGPRSIDVYDSRELELQPSNEETSSLADDTGNRVRWFSSTEMTPEKDLTIVDHLGLASPVGEVEEWKSPSTAGSLFRSRIRLDRNDAELIIESRAGNVVRSEDVLLDELSLAVGQVEGFAEKKGGCSHIEFAPNRQIVNQELQSTRLLAISSSELDPACFSRSTPQVGGFLWDYELPQAVGPGEQRSGFYLLARPPESLKRAVLRATEIVSQTDIDIDALLFETSRRGIPILKRLAAGGSLARGEIGMLLAVRLLQDSFRGAGRNVRLPVCEDGNIRMVLPVDPYVSPLGRLRQGLLKANPALQGATRPDLLVASMKIDSEEQTRIQLVPLEVKFREGKMTSQSKKASLAQAKSLGEVLHYMLSARPLNELWKLCGRGFLSEVLDHGFRVYGDPSVHGKTREQWVALHQACIADILSGKAAVSVAEKGRLIVFDGSRYSNLDDLDGDGFDETLVVSREDARIILEDGLHLTGCVDQVAHLFDSDSMESGGIATVSSREAPGPQRETPQESTLSLSRVGGDARPNQESREKSTIVPPEVREQVAGAFSGFVGNRAAIDTLKRGVLKAQLRNPPQLPASYLFTGNPSTGKTELARRVAISLDLPFVSLDGRGLSSRERLFSLIDDRLQDYGQKATRVGTQYQLPVLEYPPLIVFVDEVHLVPRSVQESLLTALEPKDRSVLLKDRVARLPQITFLFATTRPSDLDTAFKTRCTEIFLQDYTKQEVAEIVGLEYPEWPEQLRLKIAQYGRLVPRIALELARELADEVLVSEFQERDLDEHLDEVRRTRLVDENGLGRIDIDYLELLEREGKPLGERNILNMLGNIDKDRFLEEVEPLLVARMKLVRRTRQGREITSAGRQYLVDLRDTGTG